jgi:hypothetical protein
MCEPTTIAALAATAVGSAMQMQGQRQAQRAQRGAVEAENTRQRGYQQQAMGYVDTAREGASRPEVESATARAVDERATANRAAAAVPQAMGGYLPGQAGAPQIVRDEVDRQRGIASLFAGQQADARAGLGGWSDALQGVRTGITRSGQGIAMQGSFGRGSAGVLGNELQAAGGAGAGMRALGDAVVTFGPAAATRFGGSDGWGRVFSRSGGTKAVL